MVLLMVLFIEGDSVWFGVAGSAMVAFWLDPPSGFRWRGKGCVMSSYQVALCA
jgi:hypothetical protein